MHSLGASVVTPPVVSLANRNGREKMEKERTELYSVNYRAGIFDFRINITGIIFGILLGSFFIYGALTESYKANEFTIFSFLFILLGVICITISLILLPKKCNITIYSDCISFNPETFISVGKEKVRLSFSNIQKITFIPTLHSLSFEGHNESKYKINLNGLHSKKVKHILQLLRDNDFSIIRIK